MKKHLLFLAAFVLLAAALCAQTATYNQPTVNTSAYLYSGTLTGTEQLKIYTYIWGQVQKPGLYIVPDNTDLLTLISLAGGPTEDAKLTKIRIIRPSEPDQKVIYVDVKEYIETGNERLIPQLQPGDTIIVSGTVFYAFYRFSDFVSNIAIIVSVIAAVHNL